MSDSVFAGVLILSVGIPLELAVRKTGIAAYRWAVGLALAAAFLLVWTNGAIGILGSEDNPANVLYFGVLAGGGGALVARFRPRGMAGTTAATALAQASVAVGALVAGWGAGERAVRGGGPERVLRRAVGRVGRAVSAGHTGANAHGRKARGLTIPPSSSSAVDTMHQRQTTMELHTRNVSNTYANGVQILKGATPTIPLRPVLYGLLALLTTAFATEPAAGQATAQDVSSEIDEIFSWATPETPGCAVAISENGEPVVNRAYGLADLERGVPISPATIFDIGSVQKQFVAAAVLLLVEDGRISLSDDVREYFPELPDHGHTITVDHLLTHTSGIRDWVALGNFSSEDEEALAMILRQRGLNSAPGEEWSYSNSGYVLLKDLVTRTTGASFAEFARKRLFEPLGMASTSYAEDIRAAGENAALAYEKQGESWEPGMMLGEERGGGAVLSTAGDLLIWNEALTNAHLGAFVSEKLQEPARLDNGRELDYARGLFLDENRGGRVVWHTGSAHAYKSFLARYPEQGLSLAILCNAGESADRMTFARRIYDLFVPGTRAAGAEAGEPAETADSTGAEGIDVTGKAGLFFSEHTGEPLRLVVDNGRLRVAGGPALVAVDGDRFRNPEGRLSFRSQDEFELHFVSPDELELRSMEGETTRYRRAQPYAPTAAELQAFAGRYESDELRSIFDVTPADGGLRIQLNGRQTIPFEAVDRDTFQRAVFTVRFRREADGNVVALDFDTPALRGVEFTRLSDDMGSQ